MTIDPKKVSTAELFGYLTTSVAPRPVCFASTIDKAGNVNLSPFSFFNVFSANPPMMVFSPSRRVRDGSTKHTLENVLEVPEVVINIVNYPIVEQMSLTSTDYDKGVNEFEKAALTQVQSEVVGPPRVGESPVAFECVVDRVIALGDGPGAGNLILARVVMAHINEDYLGENGKLDTRKLDLIARMGGSDYCRATPESLFEIPKPILTKGIGIDGLPEHIRNSAILTGNNLGRLGNVERLPHPEDIAKVVGSASLQELELGEQEDIHRFAQKLLDQGQTWEALCWLIGIS